MLSIETTFATKAIAFYSSLQLELPTLPAIHVLNPYKTTSAQSCVARFFRKFYEDHHHRIFMLGINPGRMGGGLTGISFTDPFALRTCCGIENDLGNKRELSSEFIYKVISEFGGADQFFRHFFMSAVCPLGFMKGEKNYNYYDDPKLLKEVTPFIKRTLQQQISIGASKKILICIGTGKNAACIQSLNDDQGYFEKVVTLAHPRFIMQYKRKQEAYFIEQYVETMHGCLV